MSAQRLSAMLFAALLGGALVLFAGCTQPQPADKAPIAAGKAEAVKAAPSPYQISCETFPETITRAQLVERFGADNVKDAEIAVVAGEMEPGAVLFDQDPSRRAEVVFSRKTKGIALVRTRSTVWEGAKGLKVGMPFVEVEKLNGRMFMTSGFFWEAGGGVTHWGSDGAFAETDKRCSTLVYFTNPDDPNTTPDELVGSERVFSSQVKAIRTLNPAVLELAIAYPQPE